MILLRNRRLTVFDLVRILGAFVARQRADHQVDGLADELGLEIGLAVGRDVGDEIY